MAFLRHSNRHDSGLRVCDLHRLLLTATGLPESIALREHRFRDLLRDGAAAAGRMEVTLAALAADQWAALERFAAVFFRECESCAPLELFPAFRREAEHRSGGIRA